MDKEHFLISLMDSKYIGDDGAVVGEWIYSSDAFFEDTHFKREWLSPYQIGKKAMLVNISDAIAMGAEPKYVLVTISLPKELSKDYISELVKGLKDGALEYGCEIIGGDTIGSKGIDISITIISKSSNPLRREGLESGDILAYTGDLGEVLRDLNTLFNGGKIPNNSKFIEPILRYDFIKRAREYLVAGMDISDGLFCDTNKLLDINNLGLEPIIDIDDSIGFSGEEYEMLVALKEKNLEIVQKIAKESNTTITPFAKVSNKNHFRYPCRSHHF